MSAAYLDRLALARAERVEMQDHDVTDVVLDDNADGSIDGWIVGVGIDGCRLIVRNDLGVARAPRVGDMLRLFGRGIGYEVRGIGLVEDGELVALYRYETAAEMTARHAREVEESKAKKRADWEANKAQTAAAIAALPEPFRRRIEYFMRRPDWGWNFGPYELFCCTEAAKIVSALPDAAAVIAFGKANGAEQKAKVPMLDYRNHSGNTFGASVLLARVFHERPDLLPKMHGALCPLVGCKDYGCFAAEDKPS